MTIKNQGGVFGRNPVFNTVEAKDIDSDLASHRNLLLGETVSSSTEPLRLLKRFNGTTSLSIAGSSTAAPYADFYMTGNESLFIRLDPTNSYGDSTFSISHDGSTLASFSGSTGDVTLPSGNLVVANGKGIDFSATSGTGTSELFDDYEEGTWTVELTDASSGGNASPTTTTGYYTKIGRMVHATFGPLNNIDTTGMTAGNAIRINLPFVAGQTAAGVLVTDQLNFAAGKTAVYPMVAASSDRMTIIEAGDGVADGQALVSAITSGATDIVRMTVTYIV